MATKPVVCIGAAIIDDSFFCLDEPVHGTSNPAAHFRSAGGVARNVAHYLAQLGNQVELISHFGRDTDGKWLEEQCSSAGIGLSQSLFSNTGTGRFTGIVSPGGELFAGASDVQCEHEITLSFLIDRASFLKTASLVLLDCNLSEPCIEWLLDFCRIHAISSVVDPVSVPKASRLGALNLEQVLLITPNRDEFAVLTAGFLTGNSESAIERLLKNGVRNIWIRNGQEGSECFSCEETIRLPAPDVEVLDTTGAGDAALAGWIHARLKKKSARECLMYGHAMAGIILQTKGTCYPHLSADILEARVSGGTIQ